MSDYFTGQRDVAHIEFTAKRGRIQLACLVYEEWVPIYRESLRCGASSSSRLKRRIGVKREEKLGFEEKLGSSLGPEAIGQIKADIQKSKSFTNLWETEHETERSVTFTSPKCGNYYVNQFQLSLTTYVRILKNGFFTTTRLESSLTEYLNFFHDDSRSADNDPSCNCQAPKEERSHPDMYFILDLGSVTVKLQAIYNTSGFDLLFPGKVLTCPQSLIAGGEITVEPDWFHESTHSLLSEKITSNTSANLIADSQVKRYYREPSEEGFYHDFGAYLSRVSNHFEDNGMELWRDK